MAEEVTPAVEPEVKEKVSRSKAKSEPTPDEVIGDVAETPEEFAARKQAERDALPKLDIDNPKHGNKTYSEL